MEDAPFLFQEIVSITGELARYWRDPRLMDQLTVTRGYSELTQLDPANESYEWNLQLALRRLSEMAAQRGLPSVTERIHQMGVIPSTQYELLRTSSLATQA